MPSVSAWICGGAFLEPRQGKLKSSGNNTVTTWLQYLTSESSVSLRRYLGVTCHFLTSDWQMRSALLACLPLSGGSSGSRVLSDFDEVCHSHGVSGRAFRVVADPLLATTTLKPCCLPGFLISPRHVNLQDDNEEEEMGNGNDVEEGIRNGHGDGSDEGDWEDSLEQGLGVCRVDCFSHSLEQCVTEGLRSCPQLASTLAKAACFYNYITSAVPPEKLSQVFDGTGLAMGGPRNTPPVVRDWAAQLKVCDMNSLCRCNILHKSMVQKIYNGNIAVISIKK